MRTIEICRVEAAHGSSKYNQFNASSLPLTFFDQQWLRLPPVERLFYYEFPHPTTHFFDYLLPNLKHSLALVLGYYLPLTGHLSWPHNSPKPFIKFLPGDAVSLVIVESDASFDHLSSFDLCEATKYRNLVPHLTISEDQASVLALQVTLFPKSGFCIGTASHHAVLDGQASTLFIKSWAYLCKNLKDQSTSSTASLTPNLAPSFDRSTIQDPNGIEDRFLSDWLNHCGPNNRSLKVWEMEFPQDAIRGIFELTRTDIEKLKQSAAAKLILEGNNKNIQLSTFIVSCAYSLTCRVKAEVITKKKVQLFINVDCRSRLEPPLPPTYFGNCIANRMAVAETKELLGEDGFVVAVKAMVEAIETLKDGVLSGVEKGNPLFLGFLSSDDIRSFGTAGSQRFEVYSTDFGWGRPKKVDIVSTDATGAICFSDSRNSNGGIEIGLTLQKSLMESFASHFVEGLKSL